MPLVYELDEKLNFIKKYYLMDPTITILVKFIGVKLFYLQLEFFCLQLSFFAYSSLRPLLDALSHFSQKAPTVSRKTKTLGKNAPIVSKQAKLSIVSPKTPL